jgi:hypothetical protein
MKHCNRLEQDHEELHLQLWPLTSMWEFGQQWRTTLDIM